MLRIAFLFLLTLHALIHLLGFGKAFKLAEIPALNQPIGMGGGLLWLAAATLLLLAALGYGLRQPLWWVTGLAGLLLSQGLILCTWGDAKFGTLANLVLLLALLPAWGHWRFGRVVEQDLQALSRSAAANYSLQAPAALPEPVQRWLRASGALEHPHIRQIHLHQTGRLRLKPENPWLPVAAEQWFSLPEPAFVWHAQVGSGGLLSFEGRDQYQDGRGHMLIKAYSLLPVVDARGPELDQGVLVRFLSEIIWFPQAALAPYLRWEAVDDQHARAFLSFGGVEAGGVFEFDEQGRPVSFEAPRYYEQPGGATLETWHIDIDPEGFQPLVDGVSVPTRASVTWKLDSGDFTWYELEVTALEYQ